MIPARRGSHTQFGALAFASLRAFRIGWVSRAFSLAK